MPDLKIVLAGALLGMGGCAAYAAYGAVVVNVPVEAIAKHGFDLRSPTALQTPTGTRFHGAVCKEFASRRGASIHLDRIGVGGQILASTSQHLSGLDGRDNRCTFYDAWTDWTIAPGEHVDVCAVNSDTICRAPK
jgi:hypothetical protein